MDEEKKPALIIEFEANGSSLFAVGVRSPDDQITAIQLFGVAKYLEYKANSMLAEQEYMERQKAAMNKIAVPKPKGVIDPSKVQ